MFQKQINNKTETDVLYIKQFKILSEYVMKFILLKYTIYFHIFML